MPTPSLSLSNHPSQVQENTRMLIALSLCDKRVAKKGCRAVSGTSGLPVVVALASLGEVRVVLSFCGWQRVSKVPLDSACGCLSASAAGLATSETVREQREESDNALLRCALVVCLLWKYVMVCGEILR